MTVASEVTELLEEITNLVKSIEPGVAVTPGMDPLSTAALMLLLK